MHLELNLRECFIIQDNTADGEQALSCYSPRQPCESGRQIWESSRQICESHQEIWKSGRQIHESEGYTWRILPQKSIDKPGSRLQLLVVLLQFSGAGSNALRVSRAASLPRSASSRAALHYQFSSLYGPRSGVGLHALVSQRGSFMRCTHKLLKMLTIWPTLALSPGLHNSIFLHHVYGFPETR